MSSYKIEPSRIKSSCIIDTIPGDKSISHRSIILGSISKDKTKVENFLFSEDCLNTLNIFQKCGVPIEVNKKSKTVHISGVGLMGLKKPIESLDVGNSGTGIRLITGLLASQSFSSTINGDASIQKRPMRRIIDPLSKLNANISGIAHPNNSDIFPPLSIKGSQSIKGTKITLTIASAQIKSAILLASLYSETPTQVIEPKICRNHTEIMLNAYNADIEVNELQITLKGKKELTRNSNAPLFIPSDFSSAAFFIVIIY